LRIEQDYLLIGYNRSPLMRHPLSEEDAEGAMIELLFEKNKE